jgi:hypothetical protein
VANYQIKTPNLNLGIGGGKGLGEVILEITKMLHGIA